MISGTVRAHFARDSMNELPVPEAVELDPRESYMLHVEHFGLDDPDTEPMPLPDTIELVPRPEDEFAEALRRAGLSADDAKALSDLWAHERATR